MCTVTTDSHVFLEVHPEARPEIAATLLAAAEAAGVCKRNPCHLTATSEGFRVSTEVFNASRLTDADPATPGVQVDAAGQLEADVPAPPVTDVPDADAEGASARRRNRGK